MVGQDLFVPAALTLAVALAALCGLLLLLLARSRRDRDRVRAEADRSRAESADLRARVDALAELVAARDRPGPEPEYLITRVGEQGPADPLPPGDGRIEGRLFADIVLRESVVKAAALAHGVRLAMRPETRNRIRFEMRREVKRARRDRRDQLRSLRRERQARQRAEEVA
ncbi:hypothetical protein [Nocardioides donggukensis]|uniref:Uncharacterized protein n=1 Tax=Nocardioides donggukensis TaxID=2774019 RepID=A0A927Q2K8_9ACTN|nr:hypothetical protein [Nocardioides donggukensis]MBD8869761.1 hypothetical protein [Nocardioides donggukensis]